jgi:hypothetical protein
VKEIESLLEEGDRDAVDLADQMVRWMSRELDQAEDDNRGKALQTKFDEEYQTALELTADPEKGAERRQTEALALEFRAAIKGKDYETAKQKTDDLVALVYRLLRRLPAYWAAVFAHLCERLTQLGLGNVAQGLVQRGQQHVQNDNVGDLAQVCFEMAQLLPASEQKNADQLPGVISHVK